MKKLLLLFLSILFLFSVQAKSIKALIITGGHDYDTLAFIEMFQSFKDFDFDHLSQPDANLFIAEGKAVNYDMLVFYDMWREISVDEKQGYLGLTQKGIPMLFLHHSLVSYQNWDQFEKLLGGRYVENTQETKENQSTYKHDVWVDVIVDANHPVTKGMLDFRIFDEVYGNFRVSKNVKPLLTTNHSESTKIIGWENIFNSSKIVYLQPGHGEQTFQSPDFRKLLVQTINYLVDND